MSVQVRPNEDHEVLGSEFCSGYTDSYGKWNHGFQCPRLDVTEAVYCCGTSDYKYCCTKKDEVQHEIPNLLVIVGVIGGIALTIFMITLLSCVCCSCCSMYKKRQNSFSGDRLTPSSVVAGPLYQLHCSSTGSGVANMYSFSNQNSSVTTPIDTAGPHPIVDLDYPETHLPRNGTSPSLHLRPSYSHNSPHLTRAVTLDQCHIPTDVSSEQPEDSLSPYHGSSPSVSISFKDHVTKGHPSDRHPNCTSNGHPSTVTVSPQSPSTLASSPRDESLFRSTKF